MKARYYDGGVGRFLAQDPAFLAVGDVAALEEKTNLDVDGYLSNPQYANSYSYTINNPLRYDDKSGEFIDTILDVGFTAYSAYKLAEAIVTGDDVKGEAANFALDAGGILIPGAAGLGSLKRVANTADNAVDLTRGADVNKVNKNVDSPYKRPSNATTPEQRASVQGQPCVDCGRVDPTMTADHKTPLVKEYYETGSIDTTKMRDVGSVQPQCTVCSGAQGGALGGYSRAAKEELGI